MGYLRSKNPSAMNRRIKSALDQLDIYENTPEYKAFRAQGMSIRAALEAASAALNGGREQ